MRDLSLGDGVVIFARDLRAATSRSGGPGGQNVNKLETRVTIELDLEEIDIPDSCKALIREKLATRINREGVLRVTSQVERSQRANRDRALDRMEELLRDALARKKNRKPTRVPRSVKERRLAEKKQLAEKKKLRGKIE